ncbi:MAG TPA: putative toxin-antitoxin system toxin component, PIN family [Anaerolineae bacterium]|nr:putative toxin-antitoxin system toxin component, PIN family [Anaerolineae bacterium]
MRVVLDANLFVSAVLVPYGRPAQILQAWRNGRFELVVSPPILAEIRRVLLYPRLQRKHGWAEAEINVFLDGLRTAATITPGRIKLAVVQDDPTDDKYFSAAVEAEAACIVSGDEHLKAIGSYQGIPVLSPAAFLRDVLEISE